MPRVALTETQRLANKNREIAEELSEMLYQKHISRQKVADYIGMTRQGVNKQFHNNKISLDVMLACFKLAEPSEEEILKIARY